MKPIFFEAANQFVIESWSTANLQIKSIILAPTSGENDNIIHLLQDEDQFMVLCIVFPALKERSIVLVLHTFASKLKNEKKGHKGPALPTLAITSCQSHIVENKGRDPLTLRRELPSNFPSISLLLHTLTHHVSLPFASFSHFFLMKMPKATTKVRGSYSRN